MPKLLAKRLKEKAVCVSLSHNKATRMCHSHWLDDFSFSTCVKFQCPDLSDSL